MPSTAARTLDREPLAEDAAPGRASGTRVAARQVAAPPHGSRRASGKCERLFSDDELSALLRANVQTERRPYAKLMQHVVGAPPSMPEATAKDAWMEAVDRRDALASVLKRPVLLQVALFDMLLDKTRTPRRTRQRGTIITLKGLTGGGKRRGSSATGANNGPLPNGEEHLSRRPIVVFATNSAARFAEVHDVLGRHGFPVLPAKNEATALVLAGVAHPRVMLVDVLLPPHGGAALLSRLPPAAQDAHRWVALPQGWAGVGRKLGDGVKSLVLPVTHQIYAGTLGPMLGPDHAPIQPLGGTAAASQLIIAVASLIDGRRPTGQDAQRPELDLLARWLGSASG